MHAADVDLCLLGLSSLERSCCAAVLAASHLRDPLSRRQQAPTATIRIKKSWHWEVGWTTATLVGFPRPVRLGRARFTSTSTERATDALPIYVVAKQWMWKVQHPGGQREINELHVPVDRPVRLIMASQDVIHSFFMPAFRIKHDVVPGRYQDLWFEAGAGRRLSSVLRRVSAAPITRA